MQINKSYAAKIVIGMVAGFAVSQILISSFFASPTGIQPQNLGFLRSRIASLISALQDNFKKSPDTRTREERMRIMTEAKNQSLQPVMKGISKHEDPAQSLVYTEYNIQEIQWAETIMFLPDGKQITVRYPYGETAPSSTLLQN